MGIFDKNLVNYLKPFARNDFKETSNQNDSGQNVLLVAFMSNDQNDLLERVYYH